MSELYVKADRATHDVVAPEYANYVKLDPNLTEMQKTRRLRTLETWRMRIESAETPQR